MEDRINIKTHSSTTESIDFNKLGLILRNNWVWIALIFIVINTAAYLKIRYTKSIYESESEIKLEVKNEASELGITTLIEDKNLNNISGEIEMIKSKLFLNKVLSVANNLEVSFFSVGRLLNDELFGNPPAFVTYRSKYHSLYNAPIYFEEIDPKKFTLSVGEKGAPVSGTYGEKIQIQDLELILTHNPLFRKGDEIGYFFIIQSRDALLNYLTDNLNAEPLNYNANTVRIAFKDHNASKAQSVLNVIDSLYLHFSHEQKNLANKQKIEWLNNELKLIEERMENYENYFENFTLKNRTSDLNEDLKKTISGINKIDSQRFEISSRIKEVEQLIEGLKTGEVFPSITMRQALPAIVNTNLDALQQLLLEQEKLKLSHSERTFAYKAKQKDFETIQSKTQNQLIELQANWTKYLQDLNRKKNMLESTFSSLPDKSTQFSKNQRFYKLYEEFYLSLMQSKSQFEIAQAGSTPDFKILSPASFPHQPISPNNLMIAGIGLVFSLVLNFFFIGVLYLINNKIANLYELEKIGNVPILGMIPASRNSFTKPLYIKEYPKSMVSEAIRTLRTNLEFFNISSKKRVIAISSTVSGEGKSFLAMNLGGAIALSKKKVLLIDLDMRKPKTTTLPGTLSDNTKGISTVMIHKYSWQECITATELENLDYLPSGPYPPNPSELLLNGEFEDLLQNLKQVYDYIILDTPPVGLVTDGIMAMKHADISIYVFRANYSKKEFLYDLQRIIQINKFSNITTVLNSVRTHSKAYGYGYYEEYTKPNTLKSIFSR